MSRLLQIVCGVAVTFGLTIPVSAGPAHVETTDAGSLPASAQKVDGSGTAVAIIGELSTARGAGSDFEDMYQIFISDPANFSASTALTIGTANFNTELWLFDANGRGILANDDTQGPGSNRSTLTNAANDGTGAIVSAPGLYFLAITGFDNNPLSAAGRIFNQGPPPSTEISGPDGMGGSLPIINWDGVGAQGTYTIALTGVSFFEEIPASSNWGMAGACAVFLVVGLFLVRRRFSPQRA